MSYLLVILPILIVVALVYANRRQSRVTAEFSNPEPDIDLSYRPPVSESEKSKPDRLIPGPRDPKLSKMSTEELIMEVLKECHDPEIPLNIVDLGLVYDVKAGADSVKVKMSLTAPDCPSTQTISQDVRAKLEDAGFPNPEVELVWDPPWTPHRISEEGKKVLGI